MAEGDDADTREVFIDSYCNKDFVGSEGQKLIRQRVLWVFSPAVSLVSTSDPTSKSSVVVFFDKS